MNAEAFTNQPEQIQNLQTYEALNEVQAQVCESSDLPAEALSRFNDLGREGEGVYIRSHEFIEYLRVAVDAETAVYFAHCHKHDAEDKAEEEIFVYETVAGVQAGEGTVRLLRNAVFDEMVDTPFVVYAKSLPEHQSRERDVRRLLLMNAVSKQLFGRVVSSEDFRMPLGNEAWLALQKAGLVRHRKETDGDRYKFIA